MKGVSFIISSIGLSKNLENLIFQIDTMFENKEIILVDNSRNKLLYKRYIKSTICKYIYEEKEGISYARNKGAIESIYDILIFMDDDIVLDESFSKVNFEELCNNFKFGIASGKIKVIDKPKYIPYKYLYISGEKDYGDKKIDLPKYKYLGGCLLIMKKETFNLVQGFDTDFGHIGSDIGANEDVIIQEMVRKKKLKVIYSPDIIVYHFWNKNDDYCINRVRKQGRIERLTDKKYFKFRMFLKLIKYKIFLKGNCIFNYKSKTRLYDLERYRSYIDS